MSDELSKKAKLQQLIGFVGNDSSNTDHPKKILSDEELNFVIAQYKELRELLLELETEFQVMKDFTKAVKATIDYHTKMHRSAAAKKRADKKEAKRIEKEKKALKASEKHHKNQLDQTTSVEAKKIGEGENAENQNQRSETVNAEKVRTFKSYTSEELGRKRLNLTNAKKTSSEAREEQSAKVESNPKTRAKAKGSSFDPKEAEKPLDPKTFRLSDYYKKHIHALLDENSVVYYGDTAMPQPTRLQKYGTKLQGAVLGSERIFSSEELAECRDGEIRKSYDGNRLIISTEGTCYGVYGKYTGAASGFLKFCAERGIRPLKKVRRKRGQFGRLTTNEAANQLAGVGCCAYKPEDHRHSTTTESSENSPMGKASDHVGDRDSDHVGDRDSDHVGDRDGDHVGDRVGDHVGDRDSETLLGVGKRTQVCDEGYELVPDGEPYRPPKEDEKSSEKAQKRFVSGRGRRDVIRMTGSFDPANSKDRAKLRQVIAENAAKREELEIALNGGRCGVPKEDSCTGIEVTNGEKGKELNTLDCITKEQSCEQVTTTAANETNEIEDSEGNEGSKAKTSSIDHEGRQQTTGEELEIGPSKDASSQDASSKGLKVETSTIRESKVGQAPAFDKTSEGEARSSKTKGKEPRNDAKGSKKKTPERVKNLLSFTHFKDLNLMGKKDIIFWLLISEELHKIGIKIHDDDLREVGIEPNDPDPNDPDPSDPGPSEPVSKDPDPNEPDPNELGSKDPVEKSNHGSKEPNSNDRFQEEDSSKEDKQIRSTRTSQKQIIINYLKILLHKIDKYNISDIKDYFLSIFTKQYTTIRGPPITILKIMAR